GLLLAAVLDGPRAKEVVAAALDMGLVLNAVAPDAVRFAPNLLVTDDEIDEAVALFAKALAA
ncbi:MAG: acetylornithine transaminase, partial [Acidimicrobiia bacterium]